MKKKSGAVAQWTSAPEQRLVIVIQLGLYNISIIDE
jgi:hypothetical protein